MWTEPETTYKGTYYETVRANCDPKPIQSPHPPIWIGGGGEQLTLRVVARHADCSNFGGKPEQWAHKRDVLREHCAAVGRDPDEIRMTWSPELFIRRTQAELDAAGSKSLWGEEQSSWVAGNLVGTPEQVAEKIQTYLDLGCRRVRGVVLRLPRHRVDGLFASEGRCRRSAERAQTYWRKMISATHEGFDAPSTSNVNSSVTWMPPAISSTASSLTPRRTLPPTGTGAGKRTLLAP